MYFKVKYCDDYIKLLTLIRLLNLLFSSFYSDWEDMWREMENNDIRGNMGFALVSQLLYCLFEFVNRLALSSSKSFLNNIVRIIVECIESEIL